MEARPTTSYPGGDGHLLKIKNPKHKKNWDDFNRRQLHWKKTWEERQKLDADIIYRFNKGESMTKIRSDIHVESGYVDRVVFRYLRKKRRMGHSGK